jgi:hypothetical protein
MNSSTYSLSSVCAKTPIPPWTRGNGPKQGRTYSTVSTVPRNTHGTLDMVDMVKVEWSPVIHPGGLHRGRPGEEACQRAPSILARILARFASITSAYGHGATMWASVGAGSQASRSPLTASRARSLPVVASAARPRPRATSLGREAFSRNGLGRARSTQGVMVIA